MHNLPNLDDLHVFCTVAQRASFVATATELGVSQAFVSKRIGVLEKQLGVRLFHRTTRRVRISEDGELIYAAARKVLEDVGSMSELASSAKGEPSGQLRISTSLRLGRNHVSHVLSLLQRRYPKLDIWLELLDRRVDLVEEGYDIDIRIGEPTQPQLIAHRIALGSRILCAAPSYIERCGQPRSLAELAQHECLVFRDREQAFGVWRLQGPGGMDTVKVTGRFGSNHSDVVLNWGIDGNGILLLSVWDIAAHLKDGTLVRVLPDYREPADVWAMTSSRSRDSAKVRVCVEFMKRHLSKGKFALDTRLP
ncbi:transcriptional regulator, LysR family [Variovorax sp. HW608]|uniref:LysR family transcriptional regulator n=1 Tax=Variovorax sp. HW608 TaxID=1034889 RepID=UPI00081FE59B|nr:LysR family transcriptional regulator [Variovorax sp. HW608]SCK16235.1 transcriptional regulator, LysR family [Variovorax sp. HW608]